MSLPITLLVLDVYPLRRWRGNWPRVVVEKIPYAMLALAGAAVVVPIGFVADHVEVLYDLDVEARATAASAGLAFARAGTVGDHPLFIRMLAEVVRG